METNQITTSGVPRMECPFILPKGLVSPEGAVLRQGWLRLATGHDELYGQRHALVQADPNYGILVLLSRVVTRFEQPLAITPELLERLFLVDFVHLQTVYAQLAEAIGGIELGERWATLWGRFTRR